MVNNIGDFLNKIKETLNIKEDSLLKIIKIIEEETSIKIEKKDIILNNNIIKIKTNNYIKTEIFLKKEKIIKKIEEEIKIKIKDIF